MRKGLAKKRLPDFAIDSRQAGGAQTVDAHSSLRGKPEPASVNMRYYQKAKECFSAWQAKELKAFSGFVEKMSARTEADVTSTTKTCHAHMGTTSKLLPPAVSREVRMYSLDVGPKSRVHGFFFSGTFFLVWIDREGQILGH